MRKALSHRFSPTSTLTGAALLALLVALALGVSAAHATDTPLHNAGANYTIPEGADDSYGTAVCIVDGAAGTAASPVDSVEHDRDDDDEAFDPVTNLNDTDGGTFNFFSTTVACAGEDEGGEVIGSVADDDFRIYAGETSRVAESEYTNLVCGTGHAEGTADLYRGTDPDGTLPDLTTDLKTSFSISFVGGIGPLAITGFEGRVGLDTAIPQNGGQSDPDADDGMDPTGVDNLQDVDTGHGAGVVRIRATVGENGTANPDNNPENPPATPGIDGDDGGPAPGPDDPLVPCGNQDVLNFEVSAAFEATLSGDTDNTNYDENEDNPST